MEVAMYPTGPEYCHGVRIDDIPRILVVELIYAITVCETTLGVRAQD